MIRTELCDLVGIQYPIAQAGMGPFGTNKLCIAAANAGILGLISSSGLDVRQDQPEIYDILSRPAEPRWRMTKRPC